MVGTSQLLHPSLRHSDRHIPADTYIARTAPPAPSPLQEPQGLAPELEAAVNEFSLWHELRVLVWENVVWIVLGTGLGVVHHS